MMLKRVKETKAMSAVNTFSGDSNTNVMNDMRDTCKTIRDVVIELLKKIEMLIERAKNGAQVQMKVDPALKYADCFKTLISFLRIRSILA